MSGDAQPLDKVLTAAVEAQADALERDGVVIVERCCDAAFLDAVLAVAGPRIDAVRDALGDQDIGIGSAAGYDEIVQRSLARWDVPITPAEFGVDVRQLPWWPLVARVLGQDAEHSFSGVVYSEPGAPAQFWHTDSPHIAAEHLAPHALNVLVALHDIPVAMGPTELALGTHRLTNHLRYPTLDSDRLVYQHAATCPELLAVAADAPLPETLVQALAAGSCIVFDDRIMHRGLANTSTANRYVGYFSYRCSDYRENTHFEATQSVFAGGD